MSENPLYYSGNQKSKTSNLKPVLSSALASLEVQLDEELARYRRTRIGHRTPIQKSLGSLIAAKPQSQSAMTIASSKNQQSLTPEQAAAYIREQQASSSTPAEIKTPPPPPAPETFGAVTSNQETKDSNPQISYSLASNQNLGVPFPENINTQEHTASTSNQSSIVKAGLGENKPPLNVSPPKNENTKQPDDYLESSEALLRSLQEEESPSQTKKPKNNNDSLLSPLSIGSMLLLLVSSITFGYIIFNLDDLPSLTFGGLFKRNQQVGSIENTENVSDVKSGEQKLTPIPKNPNLASDALPGINSIDDVVGATPKAKPTPVAKPPATVANPAPAERTTTAGQVSPTNPAPVERRTTAEQVPTVENTPAPAQPVSETASAPAPQNLDEIEPSNGGFYNVIVDNTGNTLADVRKVIPDAYLSPEGKYVYLGAFKSKDRLKKHLELLKEKGITARVEEPES
ncbi:MAG: hypothetical protein AAFQ91_29190 [Cyanobacteria bacterium J06621_15]